MSWRLPRARLTRDGTLFLFGLIGITYEAGWQNAERPTLLILYAAMVGLPAFLRTDEKQKPPERPAPAPTDTESGPGP